MKIPLYEIELENSSEHRLRFAIQEYHKSTSKYLNINTIFGSICSHSTATAARLKGERGLYIDQKPVGLRLLRHVFPTARLLVQRGVACSADGSKMKSWKQVSVPSSASVAVSVAVPISVPVSVIVNVFDLPFCTCWPSHVHRATNPHHPSCRRPNQTRPAPSFSGPPSPTSPGCDWCPPLARPALHWPSKQLPAQRVERWFSCFSPSNCPRPRAQSRFAWME